MIFACVHVEIPNWRALRTIARIGLPASLCSSSAASKRNCASFGTKGTLRPRLSTIRKQCSEKNGQSVLKASRRSARTAVANSDPSSNQQNQKHQQDHDQER